MHLTYINANSNLFTAYLLLTLSELFTHTKNIHSREEKLEPWAFGAKLRCGNCARSILLCWKIFLVYSKSAKSKISLHSWSFSLVFAETPRPSHGYFLRQASIRLISQNSNCCFLQLSSTFSCHYFHKPRPKMTRKNTSRQPIRANVGLLLCRAWLLGLKLLMSLTDQWAFIKCECITMVIHLLRIF